VTAIYTFLEFMRKQGRVNGAKLDKIKGKGHLTANDVNALKKIKNCAAES
jgi:hypothetical protein